MKKKSNQKILLVAAAIAVVSASAYFATNKSSDQSGEVIAKINGSPVYSSEAQAQLTKMLGGRAGADFNALDENAKQIIVKQLAANKIILDKAYDKGLEKNENIKRKISELRDNLVKEEFLIELAQEKVTDADVKNRYDDLVQELKGKKQFKLRHIVVETESDAKKVQRELRNKKFDEVAKKESVDRNTAQIGGDLGFMVEGGMIEEFEKVVPGLKDGDVSKPFKTKFGWHIVKREGSRPAEPASFDAIKGRIEKELQAEAVQKYVTELIDSAEIKLVESKPEESESEVLEEEEGGDQG